MIDIEAVVGVAVAAVLWWAFTSLRQFLWVGPREALRRYSDAGVPCAPFRLLSGQLEEMKRYDAEDRAMEFYTDMADELGHVHAYSIGPLVILNVLEPALIRQVLRTHRDKYVKSSETFKRSLRPLLGDGVLMSEGEVWKRQRKLLAPAFHFNALKEMVPLMVGAVNQKVAKWRAMFEAGEPRLALDFQHELSDTTLEIVATAAFGPTFLKSERVALVLNRAFNVVLQELQERGAAGLSVLPVVRHLPTPGKLRVDRGCRDIEEEVRRVIRERRRGENRALHGKDLLDMLIEASDSSDGGMTEQYVVDEAVTFVFAAFETVANGFTWLARFLVEKPEVMRECRAEVRRVLGDDDERDPTYEDLGSMSYLNAVILESLRLYPPAPMISKYCVEDHELVLGDGRRVPIRSGSVVGINSYVVHRHPEHWEDPLEFRPERWMDESGGSSARAPTFGAFLAFSEGSRSCLGRPFAMLEMKVMLSKLLQNFDMEDTGEPVVATFQKLNLVPRDGCAIRLVDLHPERRVA